MNLNTREETVLAALVELFIRDAAPVSSAQILDATDLTVSSATIRNIMHGLEEKGLLYQPHTSAGRIPTTEAYRVYVQNFSRPVRLPDSLYRRIRAELPSRPTEQDIKELLVRFSRLLAGLSSNVGLGFAVEDHHDARIERVEVVQLESHRLLVVVTLDDDGVRTCIVPLEREYAGPALELAVQILNEIVVDSTPGEARRRLEAAVRSAEDEAHEIARAIAHEKNRLFQDVAVQTMHLEGATQIMGQPEFQDPENLRFLVRILDHPERLEPMLLDHSGGDEPAIHIGGGVAYEELRPFSLVSARCDLAGHAGFVGILGPVRMRYSFAVSLVSGVVETLRSIGEN